MVTETGLEGLRVLIIEDEAMIAMLIEDMLADIGCGVIGIASRFEEAMRKVSSLAFDLAILDVNLNGSQTFPVAEALANRDIPFGTWRRATELAGFRRPSGPFQFSQSHSTRVNWNAPSRQL